MKFLSHMETTKSGAKPYTMKIPLITMDMGLIHLEIRSSLSFR